jgi:hypothetical protein
MPTPFLLQLKCNRLQKLRKPTQYPRSKRREKGDAHSHMYANRPPRSKTRILALISSNAEQNEQMKGCILSCGLYSSQAHQEYQKQPFITAAAIPTATAALLYLLRCMHLDHLFSKTTLPLHHPPLSIPTHSSTNDPQPQTKNLSIHPTTL